MSLALTADFIMASRRAFFCMSFAKLGLIPDMGALYAVPRLIGMVMARDLMLTARRVGAEETRQIGLIHSVYQDDELLNQARLFAGRFRGAARGALGTTKRLLNQSFESHYAPLAELEANAQAVETCSAYHAQALTRFLHKEPALYDWDREVEAAKS